MSKPLWYPRIGDGDLPPKGAMPPPGGGYVANPPPGSCLPANQGYNRQPAFTKQWTAPPPPQRPLVDSGRGAVSTYPPFRQLLANDWVMVELETRGWVLGLVVGVLKAVDALTNWSYRVRYRPPDAQMDQERVFPSERVQGPVPPVRLA
ncbi:hypothetical protein LshimejAT787_0800870 [Lyophyllum shimeji]|uniref:Uncharacterized protein n=1 Tax=Lyophyllum shimeji TaxID=47721 RepID=A0A9P3PRX1_LYOSH|nr:hypothetical protein LshimejAT787_0800870 [Lyophyllum shimeji]